jgi:hypothetical protein
MNDGINVPLIPRLSEAYDARQLMDVIQQLTNQMALMRSPGRVRAEQLTAANINVSNLPTSSVGLNTGDVWWDTGTNTLKVVP